jgi:hypothetical protein
LRAYFCTEMQLNDPNDGSFADQIPLSQSMFFSLAEWA